MVFFDVDGFFELLLQVLKLLLGEVAFEYAVLDALSMIFHVDGYAAKPFGVGNIKANNVEVFHSR